MVYDESPFQASSIEMTAFKTSLNRVSLLSMFSCGRRKVVEIDEYEKNFRGH